MHTQNLHQDARASLLIAQPDSSGDPLGAACVTLLGTSAEVPAETVRDLYLSCYENAKYWQEHTDFAYQRLKVSSSVKCLLHRRFRCNGVGPGCRIHPRPARSPGRNGAGNHPAHECRSCGCSASGPAEPAAAPEPPKRKPRRISAAGRKAIAHAQRKRWAEAKKANEPAPQERAKPKRRLSAAGRAAIIAATKKRWALVRAAAAKAAK